MTTSAGPTTAGPWKSTEDFDALLGFFADQAAASVKRGEEFLEVARKQTLSSIQHAQEFALQSIDKVSEVTSTTLPPIPGWLPVSAFTDAITASFDVAEKLLAAERKVTASFLSAITTSTED
jgi:hypothetical protein